MAGHWGGKQTEWADAQQESVEWETFWERGYGNRVAAKCESTEPLTSTADACQHILWQANSTEVSNGAKRNNHRSHLATRGQDRAAQSQHMRTSHSHTVSKSLEEVMSQYHCIYFAMWHGLILNKTKSTHLRKNWPDQNWQHQRRYRRVIPHGHFSLKLWSGPYSTSSLNATSKWIEAPSSEFRAFWLFCCQTAWHTKREW